MHKARHASGLSGVCAITTISLTNAHISKTEKDINSIYNSMNYKQRMFSDPSDVAFCQII